MNTEETQPADEKPDNELNQMADDMVEKVNYVRSWLDCAPDFPVLMETLLLKMAVDRGPDGDVPREEIANAERWLESFYKDLSAMMGSLESHIMLAFPPGQHGPAAQLTEKGAAWIKHHKENPPQPEA